MNSLFSEFFKEFWGVILGVCETTWGLFGGHFEGVWEEIRGESYSKNKNKQQNLYLLLFTYLALGSLFNEQGVVYKDQRVSDKKRGPTIFYHVVDPQTFPAGSLYSLVWRIRIAVKSS